SRIERHRQKSIAAERPKLRIEHRGIGKAQLQLTRLASLHEYLSVRRMEVPSQIPALRPIERRWRRRRQARVPETRVGVRQRAVIDNARPVARWQIEQRIERAVSDLDRRLAVLVH